MTPSSLDHLVVACQTLDEGAMCLNATLGVEAQPGGVHSRMGTHNRLLRLGPRQYLELLAPNPEATDLEGSRWFGLDEPATLARLQKGPFLLTWVARAQDLESAVSRFPALGRVRAFERGSFRWDLTLPAGPPSFDGVLPILIRWQGETHPADKLENRGCELRSLSVSHADVDGLRSILEGLGLDGVVRVRHGPPSIHAVVRSPRGDVELGRRS